MRSSVPSVYIFNFLETSSKEGGIGSARVIFCRALPEGHFHFKSRLTSRQHHQCLPLKVSQLDPHHQAASILPKYHAALCPRAVTSGMMRDGQRSADGLLFEGLHEARGCTTKLRPKHRSHVRRKRPCCRRPWIMIPKCKRLPALSALTRAPIATLLRGDILDSPSSCFSQDCSPSCWLLLVQDTHKLRRYPDSPAACSLGSHRQ